MTDAEAADHLHQIMVMQDRIIALEGDLAHVMALCARAADALEQWQGGWQYSDMTTDLVSELRKAAE